MIRERSLLEIEMYKRARQQFCSRGYVLPFFYCFLKPMGKIIFFPLVPTKSTVGVGLKSFASTYPICAQRPSLEAPGSPPALGVPAGSRNAGGRRCCQGENG